MELANNTENIFEHKYPHTDGMYWYELAKHLDAFCKDTLLNYNDTVIRENLLKYRNKILCSQVEERIEELKNSIVSVENETASRAKRFEEEIAELAQTLKGYNNEAPLS